MKHHVVEIASVYRELEEAGVKSIVIGDTCIQLALGYSELEGDLDLFVIEPSPLVERAFFQTIAEEKNWEISTSETSLPALVIPLSQGYLIVELYENYMDIEIPEGILNDTVEYRIDNTRIKTIKPEHYIVLKARQGVDLDKLRKYIHQLKKGKLNTKIIEQSIKLYPRSEREIIVNRLRDTGLDVSIE